MNPRNFLGIFKTRSGRLLIFGVLFAAGLIIFSATRKHHTSAEDDIHTTPIGTNTVGKPQVVQSVLRSLQLFNPPSAKSQTTTGRASVAASSSATTSAKVISPTGSPSPEPLPVVPANQLPTLTPISLFADSSAGVARPKKLSAAFAPFGRLISCETIITVDSSSIQTPIIGLVTENIYYRGKLIIPAGTEVHGMAQTDRQRERIAGNTSWTFVWQNGREMRIKAIALDREFDNATNQSGWGITDGSAGLRGELIKSDNWADIKLFAATFLSGAANALTEKQETVFGPVNAPSLNNAPFQGAQAVLQTYAQQIYDTIQRDGFYVRVPSGKQFYLYVLQTIDRADSTIGGVGLAADSDEQPSTTPKP
jgi:hypothetical protein